jgi:hypothetical protein
MKLVEPTGFNRKSGAALDSRHNEVLRRHEVGDGVNDGSVA